MNIQAVSFPGYTGESIFQVRLGEKSEKVYYYGGWWDANPRLKKTMVLPTTPFAKELVG